MASRNEQSFEEAYEDAHIINDGIPKKDDELGTHQEWADALLRNNALEDRSVDSFIGAYEDLYFREDDFDEGRYGEDPDDRNHTLDSTQSQ